MKIEREVRSSMTAIERPSQIGNHEMKRIERELQHLRRQCTQLEEEVKSSAKEKRHLFHLHTSNYSLGSRFNNLISSERFAGK